LSFESIIPSLSLSGQPNPEMTPLMLGHLSIESRIPSPSESIIFGLDTCFLGFVFGFILLGILRQVCPVTNSISFVESKTVINSPDLVRTNVLFSFSYSS